MGAQIAALAYVCIALFAGRVLAMKCFPERRADVRLISNVWLALSAMIFVLPSALVFVVLAGTLLGYLAPRDPARRLMFWCAVLPAAPVMVGWRVPFPGLPYLIDFRYVELVNTVVLLPVLAGGLMSPVGAGRGGRGDPVLRMGLLFLAITMALGFRSNSVTNGIRDAASAMLWLGIPLLALPVALRRENAVRELKFALMLVAMFMICIGVLQYLKGWSLYGGIPKGVIEHLPKGGNSFRGGEYRVEATMAPIPFGLYMAVACGLVLWQKDEVIPLLWRRGSAFLLAVGAYISTSRAALLCLLIIVGVQFFYSRRFASLRMPAILAGVMLLAVLQGVILDKVLAMDEYGTFSYRLELLQNAAPSIAENPLFGSPDFKDDETMQKSMQGQHIIDVVNIYLIMLLRYGFIGVTAFTIPLLIALRLLTKRRREQELRRDIAGEANTRLMLGLVVGYGLTLATVSDIDRLMLYYWLLLGLGSAVARGTGMRTANGTASGAANGTANGVVSGTAPVPGVSGKSRRAGT